MMVALLVLVMCCLSFAGCDAEEELPTIAQLAEERVAAAIVVLDEENPNWWKKVSVAALDINHAECCVLGQVFGNYYSNEVYHMFGSSSQKRSLGFDSEPGKVTSEELLDAWTAVLVVLQEDLHPLPPEPECPSNTAGIGMF